MKKLKLGDYTNERIGLDSWNLYPYDDLTLDICNDMRNTALAKVKGLETSAYTIYESFGTYCDGDYVNFTIDINIKKYYTEAEISSHNDKVKEYNKKKKQESKESELMELARLKAKYEQ